MADDIEQLMIEVRASTGGFTADVQAMRASFDSILVDGLGRAGDVLERGLLGAIRRGSLGFEDLRRIALAVIGDIAANAVRAGLGALSGGGGGGQGGLFNLGSLLGSILGLQAARPADWSAPGAATSSASAAPNCSCRPARARSNPMAADAAGATCASRSRWSPPKAPPRPKASSARAARWRAQCGARSLSSSSSLFLRSTNGEVAVGYFLAD